MHSQGTISVIFRKSRSLRDGTLRSPRMVSQWRNSARLPGCRRSGSVGTGIGVSLSIGFMPRGTSSPPKRWCLIGEQLPWAMHRACQPGHPVIGSGGRYRVYEEAVMTVGHILSQKGSAVVTAKPDDTVHAVGKLLTSHKVGAVVVLDGEAIAGIVSERDIVRMIAERGEQGLKLPVSEI